MKKKTAIIIFLIFVSILTLALFIINDHKKPKEINLIEFDFGITNEKLIGINADRDKLHFGTICNGCYGHRVFTIVNQEKYYQKLIFLVASKDPVVPTWFSFEPDSRKIIKPGEKISVNIFVEPNFLVNKEEFYEGNIFVEIYKAWPWEIEKEIAKLTGCFSEDFMEILNCK